jgi:hypothetical protein
MFPTVLLAQPTAFYLGDGLENFDDQQLKSSSPVYLSYVTPDSLMIMPELGDVKHSATYKRNPNESFSRRKTSWSSVRAARLQPATDQVKKEIFAAGLPLVYQDDRCQTESYFIHEYEDGRTYLMLMDMDNRTFALITDLTNA